MLVENQDYYVRAIPFPTRKVKACVCTNEDDTYSIFVNSLLSDKEQKEALTHELNHIKCNHFESDAPIADIEQEASCL